MEYANLILELYDRVNKLEKEVEELKKKVSEVERPPIINSSVKEQQVSPEEQEIKPRERNKDKFLFNGSKLPKNQFVLSVIKKYVLTHPAVTREELKKIFPKNLQGSFGVVEDLAEAQKRYDYKQRYFTDEKDIINLIDGKMYVCNQWGVLNIGKFIEKAESLGFAIEII